MTTCRESISSGEGKQRQPMNVTKQVVLLEFPDEAAAYLNGVKGEESDPNTTEIVSLDPSVQILLKQRGLPYETSACYFSSDSHARALLKSHEILKWLEIRFSFHDRMGIHGAYENALLWYSRFFVHAMIWSSEIIAEVHSKHPGAEIRAAVNLPAGSANPRLQESDRYIGILAQNFCWRVGLPFKNIVTGNADTVTDRDNNPVLSGIRRLGLQIAAVLHRRTLRRLGKLGPLLSLTHAYRMDDLAAECQYTSDGLPWVVLGEGGSSLRGSNLASRALGALAGGVFQKRFGPYEAEVWLSLLERTVDDDPEFTTRLQENLDTIASAAEEDTDMFSHRDVEFGRAYADKLRSGIGPAIQQLHRQVAAADEMLNLLRPRFMLTPFGRRSQHALGELGNKKGIPGLLVAHASFTPYKNELEEIAWKFHGDGLFNGSFTHAALQTPMAEKFSQQLDSPAKFVPTGPLVWGSPVDRNASLTLRKQMTSGRDGDRIIVHASTPHDRSSTHFHVYETMDEYVETLTDLVLAVEQLQGVYLIIKAKPAPLGKKELEALLPSSDRFTVSVEEPFTDVLGMSDLLVSLSSTTVEEALLNRVPVLFYGGNGRYQHVEAQPVTPDLPVAPGAAFSVSRPDHLADAIQRVLDVNGPTPLPENLFDGYSYKPEEITPLPQLVKELVGG